MFKIFVFVASSISVFSIAETVNPKRLFYDTKEIFLKPGEILVVPECRKIQVLDISKLKLDLWIELNGIVEFTDKVIYGENSYSMNGNFTFLTKGKELPYKVILHEGTSIKLLANNKSIHGGIPLVQYYDWDLKIKCNIEQ